MSDEIVKGKAMHQLTSKYWLLSKGGKLSKDQTWQWKRMCETFSDFDDEELKRQFEEIFPPELEKDDVGDIVDSGIKPQRIPKSNHAGETKWNSYFLGNPAPT